LSISKLSAPKMDFMKHRISILHSIYTTKVKYFTSFNLLGFKKIQCLEAYSNTRALWLECNGLEVIQGLDELKELTMLYLH